MIGKLFYFGLYVVQGLDKGGECPFFFGKTRVPFLAFRTGNTFDKIISLPGSKLMGHIIKFPGLSALATEYSAQTDSSPKVLVADRSKGDSNTF